MGWWKKLNKSGTGGADAKHEKRKEKVGGQEGVGNWWMGRGENEAVRTKGRGRSGEILKNCDKGGEKLSRTHNREVGIEGLRVESGVEWKKG